MNNEIGTIQIKGKTYKVKEFVGNVAAADRQMETVVSGGGNNDRSTVSSTTFTHDRLFLVNESGQEKAFEFTDIKINARVDHRIQILWMIRAGNERGCYVSVKNLTTGDHYWIDEGIKTEVVPFYGNWLVIAPFLIVTILMAFFTLGLSLLLIVWAKMNEKSSVKETKAKLSPFIKTS